MLTLKETQGIRRKDKIIITDTLFSMDGDCAARLRTIGEMAGKYRCMVMVDEAACDRRFRKDRKRACRGART